MTLITLPPLRYLIALSPSLFPLVMAAGCLLVSFRTGAAEGVDADERIDYSCPKYEAGLQFHGERLLKSFGDEFSWPPFETYARTGNARSSLTDCSTKTLFCLEERLKEQVKSKAHDTDVFIYAVPRRTKTGDTYQVRGVKFRVDRHPEFPGMPPSAVILAEGQPPGGNPVRYKMYVEQGTGIKVLHFERQRGFPHGSTMFRREYISVTCTLASKRGLFPGVRVHVTPPPHVVDY